MPWGTANAKTTNEMRIHEMRKPKKDKTFIL